MRNRQLNIIFLAFGLGFLISCSENEPEELFVVNNCNCIDEENHTYGSVVDIDQNIYNTVTIGSQEWMAENLKTKTYNDGTLIPNKKNDVDWLNNTAGAYCWYNNNEAKYKEQYGALYNSYVIETEKICPIGWHIPSEDEWLELYYFIMDDMDVNGFGVADLLATPRCWYYNEIEERFGIDHYGFSALGAGQRNGGIFIDLGFGAYWWTSSEYINDDDWTIYCLTPTQRLGIYLPYPVNFPKNSGLSIRCVKD
jgi:uncharacterized protein (TIGR02145 family)